MHFFVLLFVFIYTCFAADPDHDKDLMGGDRRSPVLQRVPSYSCHQLLAGTVSFVITSSKTPVTLVFDFDEVLVKEGRTDRVPTLFAQEIDGILANPEVRKKVHGILVLTARLARPMDEKNIKCEHSIEVMDTHRKDIILTTNEELQRCVPNIASLLRSSDNFGGMLPDFLRYFGDTQYQKDGYGVHEEGFIYNCGLFVMGGAMNTSKKLRHCKHFTLREALKLLPMPDCGYGILYVDDHKSWFAPFVEKGLGNGVSMYLFHYNADVAETRRSVQPAYPVANQRLKYYNDEDDSFPNIKSMFYSALKYAATAAVVYCVLCPIDSIRQSRIVRFCERVFLWAAYLTVNCIRKIAFRVLFGKK